MSMSGSNLNTRSAKKKSKSCQSATNIASSRCTKFRSSLKNSPKYFTVPIKPTIYFFVISLVNVNKMPAIASYSKFDTCIPWHSRTNSNLILTISQANTLDTDWLEGASFLKGSGSFTCSYISGGTLSYSNITYY